MEPVNYKLLTQPQRAMVRKEYIVFQQGNCHYCGNPLTDEPTEKVVNTFVLKILFPPKFFDHPIHLHHNHKTGMTIGAVHAKCNAVLWQYHNE